MRARRPALPPIFIMSIAIWIGCAFSLEQGRTVDGSRLSAIAIIALLATVAVFIALLARTHSFMALIALGLSLGILFGVVSAYALNSERALVESCGLKSAELEILEDSRKALFGNECLAKLKLDNGTTVTVALRMDDNALVRFGDRIACSFRIRSAGFDTSSYWWNKGACAILSVDDWNMLDAAPLSGIFLSIRNKAIDSLCRIEGEEAIVASALACGYRYELFDSPIYGRFKQCGLAHLVAVSGAHIVIVVSFANIFLRRSPLPKGISTCVLIMIMLLYLTLSGCPLSAIRATIMAALSLFSFTAKRRPSSLNALGVCISLMIAHNPFCALSTSLLLSCASTAGILLFNRHVNEATLHTAIHAPSMVRESLALTVSSQIVCLPISASLFSQVPLVALLANVICTPLFTFACVCALAFAIIASIVGSFALQFFGLFSAPILVLCGAVRMLANLPFASIPCSVPESTGAIASVAIAALVWAIWPRAQANTMRIALAASSLILVAYVVVSPLLLPTRIVMLDVGQGDAILIQSRGRNVLIDTGNQDSKLKEALARNGAFHLDAVLITHTDDDHCGSLEALACSAHIDEIILSEAIRTSDEPACAQLTQRCMQITDRVAGVKVGDIVSFGDFSLRVDWPYKLCEQGGNADSLCCDAQIDIDRDGRSDCAALFTGDAEIEQLVQVANAHDLNCIDILKVAHHGSNTGTDAELLERLQPKIALISAGANNRYGHPKPEVLAMLEDAGSVILRTDCDGDVTCTIQADRIDVTSQR